MINSILEDQICIEQLKEEFDNLPGYVAQQILEPPFRGTLSHDDSNAKLAATMLPLYFQDEWKIILIKRSNHPKDKHKGQISFAGGRVEKNESSKEAALREVDEEINIKKHQLKLIGQLTPLYIPVSNFKVFPFVSFIDVSFNELQLSKQEEEVSEILHFSVNDLLNPKHFSRISVQQPNGMKIQNIPAFQIKNYTIWGATAMMLNEFLHLIKRIKF